MNVCLNWELKPQGLEFRNEAGELVGWVVLENGAWVAKAEKPPKPEFARVEFKSREGAEYFLLALAAG